MSFDSLVEAIIKEAQAQGEFDNLPGKGKPIDLTGYFNTPEEIRNAYALLKNAGVPPVEVQLLQEISELKEQYSSISDIDRRGQILKALNEKMLQLNILMDRRQRL